MISYCLRCGKEYEKRNSAQKYCCKECAKKAKKIYTQKRKEYKPANQALHEIANEALKHHMSYGKYVDSQRC